jgi:hypothetical protein
MVSESKHTPPVPYNVFLPKPLPDSPMNLPMSVTKQVKIAKPTAKSPKAKPNEFLKARKRLVNLSHGKK